MNSPLPWQAVRSSTTLIDAYADFCRSTEFRKYPLKVQASFESAFAWLPKPEKMLSLTNLSAHGARRLRNRGARERGWRFGNMVLALLQILVARGIANGDVERD